MSSTPITFNLPSSDSELVDQVYSHIEDVEDFNAADTLLLLSRKYRFAGYIGSIHYLFSKMTTLTDEVETLKEEIAKLKKQKKSSWFF